MHKREIQIGQQTLSIETGKLAKQADGSVIVRLGDTMVLVTACHAASAARGHRLPAAHRRLPRIHLRVGTHSRRLLQARRQGHREGSPDQPLHRSADSSALSRRLALRNADHRVRDLRRHRERRRRARHHRRVGGAGALRDAVREDHRRRARRPHRRAVRHQPDLRAAQAEPSRPGRRRQQGRHRDGRGRREGSLRRGGACRRSKPDTPRSASSATRSTRWRRTPAARSWRSPSSPSTPTSRA